MAWLRGLLTVALVVTAVLLEITVLPWLHLPGAVPDIVAVTVAALGYAAGPVRGAAAGFLAGLLLDLVPPADGLLGLTAVVLVVVGYLAGVAGGIQDRPAVLVVLLVGALSGLAVLLLALVGGVVTDPPGLVGPGARPGPDPDRLRGRPGGVRGATRGVVVAVGGSAGPPLRRGPPVTWTSHASARREACHDGEPAGPAPRHHR